MRELLTDLEPIVASVTTASDDVGIFGCVLRSALAKSFEFAAFVHADPPPANGFFVTSTLRGICEDLIVLSFINQLEVSERHQVVSLLMAKHLTSGIAAQSEFFGAARPWQPVLQPPKTPTSDVDEELMRFSVKLGWSGRQSWPTVWYMAKACSLAHLYSYIYAATSKWVHFSPHVLLRMGWGGSKDDLSDKTPWTFTTKNFDQYYVEFNRVYSLMLLLRLLGGVAGSVLPSTAAPIRTALQIALDQPLRWPEDVTFEEMNLDGPSYIQRIMFRAAHEVMAAEKSE